MEEEIISFTVAKLAKEKGFNEVSDGCFDINGKKHSGMNHKNEIGEGVFSAPTQSLLQKWLREVHHINVYCVCRVGEWTYWIDKISPLSQEPTTYEKALEEGLREGLNLI